MKGFVTIHKVIAKALLRCLGVPGILMCRWALSKSSFIMIKPLIREVLTLIWFMYGMDKKGREEPNPSLLKLSKPSHSTEMSMSSAEYNLCTPRLLKGTSNLCFLFLVCWTMQWKSCEYADCFCENVYCLISSKPAVLFDSTFLQSVLTVFIVTIRKLDLHTPSDCLFKAI